MTKRTTNPPVNVPAREFEGSSFIGGILWPSATVIPLRPDFPAGDSGYPTYNSWTSTLAPEPLKKGAESAELFRLDLGKSDVLGFIGRIRPGDDDRGCVTAICV
jgi:hypothetical protein